MTTVIVQNNNDDNDEQRTMTTSVTTLQSDLRLRALQQWRDEEKIILFLLFLLFVYLVSFFFQSYYKGNMTASSKHTQRCTTQMFISKPMYKENKWGYIT
jgi:Tfp pilus assembly protein PilO